MFPTLLGKILVFFILVCSLMFAAIALGLYANRVNWPGGQPAVAGENAEGELGKLLEEIKQQSDSVQRGQLSWQAARDTLAKLESVRKADQAWYAEQIEMRKTGRDKGREQVNNPVRAVVYAEGKVQSDSGKGALTDDLTQKDVQTLAKEIAGKHPKMEDLDLKDLQALDRETQETEGEVNKVEAAIAGALKEQAKLSKEIQVLRVLIEEEVRARQNSVAEVEYLEPQLYNREVESQMLMQRQRALVARLKELKTQGVASRTP